MQYALSRCGQKERDQTSRETTLRENLERCEEIISRYETQLKSYIDHAQQERFMFVASSSGFADACEIYGISERSDLSDA